MLFVCFQHFPCHFIGACDKNTLIGALFAAHLRHVAALLEIQAGAVVDASFFHRAVFAKGRLLQAALIDRLSQRQVNALRYAAHAVCRHAAELNAGVNIPVPVDVGLAHSQFTDVARPVFCDVENFFLKGIEIDILSPAE